mgnify:FL=1
MAVRSEHLAEHDRGHGRKHGDSQGCKGILALRNSNSGDHAGSETSHAQLGGEVVGSLQGIKSAERTVGSALNPVLTKKTVRYAASGFVT